MSDVLLREIAVVAETPTVEELRARLASRAPAPAAIDNAAAVRAERDAR